MNDDDNLFDDDDIEIPWDENGLPDLTVPTGFVPYQPVFQPTSDEMKSLREALEQAYVGPIFSQEWQGKFLEPECQHEPVEVGFQFTKMVCKKCDKDL